MADTPKKGAEGFSFFPAHAQYRHAQYGHVRKTQNPSGKKVWVSVYSELQSD